MCSGIGMPNIYAYLRDSGLAPESAAAAAASATGDRTRVIVQAALRQPDPDPLCAATMDGLSSILGAEAGNLALKVLATGGVYLAGGIPPRVLPVRETGHFMEAFGAKGRLRDLLNQMPVHVVTQPIAIVGAALPGFEVAARAVNPTTDVKLP